uniref:Calponin-homology (CH) domain-containing protein n=1 Tax=Amphilophus citrinellus TaxID=61819 RepID=A0A3Q0R7Y7_AMPCI
MEQLRDSIESRLKVVLPEDLGSSLMDGVVLCHLANHIRPRSVASIHVPSPAVPKLSMAKCRRNVENFLDACRKIGVPQEATSAPNPTSPGASETPLLVSVTTQTPPPAWQIWDLIGSSLIHILCLVLLFVAYSWTELT